MKRKLSGLVIGALAVSVAIPVGFGQEDRSVRTIDPEQLHVLSEQSAREAVAVRARFGDASSPINAATSALPVWTYQVTAAQNRQRYTGLIVGQSPTSSTKTTTTVPVVLIPVVLKITQGGVTYTFSPTSTDSGCLGSLNAFSLMRQSPLFNNASFTFNGVNVGTTQYADAVLRGEFWHYLGSASSPYHLRLSLSTAPALTISVNAGTRGNTTAEVINLSGPQCGTNTLTNPHGKLAVVNINTIDGLLQSYANANGLNASQFPFFVTYNAVASIGAANNPNNCCVLGYHSALGNPGQTYGIAEFEGRNQTAFPGVSDVAAASHEINEWVNDPNAVNPTPPWGNLGQVSGCQGNFEDGDPLTGTLIPTVTMPNGFTYHLQELAYFSWFYGGTSLGTGGKYSNHGTFAGAAKLCPPGGTN
jgi:hypothetical protein